MFRLFLFLIVFIFSFSAQGAVKKYNAFLETLKKPMHERLDFFSKNKQSFSEVKKLAFSKEPMTVRWQALLTLPLLNKARALPLLKQASKNSEWFMRNAALVGLSSFYPKEALSVAKKLFLDPSLVVRTEAVQVLSQHGSQKDKNLLWTQLYHKRNFHGAQSLWIRKHIVKTLASWASQEEAQRFSKILKDRDSSLYIHALKGLEQATGKSFSGSKKLQRSKWLSWSKKVFD